MAVISAMKFTFVLLILSLDLCSTTIARKCPEGMFRKNRKCVQCSDCPKDQIVREICTEHKDVVCGVYTEWHQNQNVNPMPQIKVKSPAPTEVSSTSSKNNQANVIVKGKF
ncbi:unnamed protein product [Owenia fusiformis]|uniref:TNFR-Cys domain-containing protein n=1 Tax=Owenia fusiformis TaxID=6347 RepID=A0A8S4P2L4_OWEFU|nr:unnamed protein product [Owenia fusiformis]